MIKYFIVLFLIFICCFQAANAQSKRKNGDFYYKIKTYDRAIREFERELKKKPGDKKIISKIVDCYLNSNLDKSRAFPYVDQLLRRDSTIVNMLNFGKVMFYSHDYKYALEFLEKVKLKAELESIEAKDANTYINWIINAQAYEANPVDVSFINLGKKINTSKNELNPMVSGDDKLLVYSNNKRYHSDIAIYYYNINVSHNKNLNWLKPKTIGSAVNSGYDEIVSGLSPDGSRLYVYHNRDWVEQIGFSNYAGNYKFSRLEPFDKGWNKKKGTFGVWQSSTQDTLFFVGQSEKGDTDIFYTIKLPNGEFGVARPIKGAVNTEAEENFPILSSSGKRLYFSSNGKASMGGFDLFYSDWDEENKEWKSPVNLGYPINDVYDNYTISHNHSERYAYVAAIRPEGYGERDIYKLIYNDEAPANIILKCNVLLETDTGNIIPPNGLRVELSDSISGSLLGEYVPSLDSSKFILAIEPGKYKLKFFSKDALLNSIYLSIPELWFGNIPYYREFIIPKPVKEEE